MFSKPEICARGHNLFTEILKAGIWSKFKYLLYVIIVIYRRRTEQRRDGRDCYWGHSCFVFYSGRFRDSFLEIQTNFLTFNKKIF